MNRRFLSLKEFAFTSVKAPGRSVAPSPAAEEAVLALDGAGTVWDCTPSVEVLFKYRRDDLIARHISELLPELEGCDLVKDGQLSPRIYLLSGMGHAFQAVTSDGRSFAVEIAMNRHGNLWLAAVRRSASPIVARRPF